jgi:hypothetical protein
MRSRPVLRAGTRGDYVLISEFDAKISIFVITLSALFCVSRSTGIMERNPPDKDVIPGKAVEIHYSTAPESYRIARFLRATTPL